MPKFQLSLATLLVALCAAAFLPPAAAADTPFDSSKTECVYTGPIAPLASFESLIGRSVNCALVYNDASPDWAGWEDPWFTHHPDPNLNWVKWQQADPLDRRLIITQNLFPSQLNDTDWRTAGAAGAFTDHARALARRLVAVGQGNAVIRLGHEANGTWYPDSIGNTDSDFELWREFWRQTVLAMKSVPGAHFEFDLSVNAAYRAIPLSKYYPGDDVVDIIGIDAYDSGVSDPAGQSRWQHLNSRPQATGDVVAFAKAHGKPISIPEWGVGPTGDSSLAAGDDPAYVNAIADLLRNNQVAYESYFFAETWANQLECSPQSLLVYQQRFGPGMHAAASVPDPSRSAATVPDPTEPAPAPAGSAPAPARPSSAQVVVRSRRGGAISHRVSVAVNASVPGISCVTVLAGRRKLASGKLVLRKAGRASVRLRATALGRRSAKRLRSVTVVSVFTPKAGGGETSVQRLRLR